MRKNTEEALYVALKRRALGETLTETQEEYGFEDGEAVLKRRRVTKKEVPPDLSAVKMLMEGEEAQPLSALSDAELSVLEAELLSALSEQNGAKGGRPSAHPVGNASPQK